MRSVVVVVGVAIVFVVSASPLPKIFQNYIALYGNSSQCQTQSNLGENRKDTTTRNCLLKWVPSPEMISQRKIAEFLGYPHPPSHHTHNQKTCYWNKGISSKPHLLLWFGAFSSTIHKFTNDFDEKMKAVNCQSASPVSQFSSSSPSSSASYLGQSYERSHTCDNLSVKCKLFKDYEE